LASSRDELILDAVRGKRPSFTGWVRVDCPLCETRGKNADRRQSLGVKLDSGGFRCFRCHAHGRVQQLANTPRTQEQTADDEIRPDLGDPSDYFPTYTDEGMASEALAEARAYLARRGFTREHQERADMHVAVTGRYAGRVILPHKDAAGVWWGFTARAYSHEIVLSGGPKVLYPRNMPRRIYNWDGCGAANDTSSVTMLVEGVLDAVWYLPHVVATLGKPTGAHLDMIVSRFGAHRFVHGGHELRRGPSKKLVICLDGDAWEEARSHAYRLQLQHVHAGYVRLPAGEDPNSVDPDWLRSEVAAVAATL